MKTAKRKCDRKWNDEAVKDCKSQNANCRSAKQVEEKRDGFDICASDCRRMPSLTDGLTYARTTKAPTRLIDAAACFFICGFNDLWTFFLLNWRIGWPDLIAKSNEDSRKKRKGKGRKKGGYSQIQTIFFFFLHRRLIVHTRLTEPIAVEVPETPVAPIVEEKVKKLKITFQ